MTETTTLPLAPSREPRPDRWCKARMAEFLRILGASHSVAEAARAVGMSRQSAYRLRARPKGQPFDIAWEAAFQHGYDALAQAALERALHGVEVPVYRQGELVGSYRKYDERLTCFLLGRRNRSGAQRLGRYTAASEFWSERWDRMLDRVEYGATEWVREGLEGDDDETRETVIANADGDDGRQLCRKHAPDEPPGKRGR